jgi:cell wall-associated NlpC family hydrolase
MSDLFRRAAIYVGTPYLLHGRDPSGWDCRGCVGWLRQTLLKRPTPFWGDDYPLTGLSRTAFANTVAELITIRLRAWREVEPGPGAVVLLTLFQRPAHVGLMLDRRNFIHAEPGPATAINRIDEPRWAGRVRGFHDV